MKSKVTVDYGVIHMLAPVWHMPSLFGRWLWWGDARFPYFHLRVIQKITVDP